jgi:hypothetical protein
MVPLAWIEHATSPLPRECSATELQGRNLFELRQNNTNSYWSGERESNPRHQLGRLRFYHLTTAANQNQKSKRKPTCWWRGKDSNLRRQSRQIYSLFPLTAREPLQRNRQLSSFHESTSRKKSTKLSTTRLPMDPQAALLWLSGLFYGKIKFTGTFRISNHSHFWLITRSRNK